MPHRSASARSGQGNEADRRFERPGRIKDERQTGALFLEIFRIEVARPENLADANVALASGPSPGAPDPVGKVDRCADSQMAAGATYRLSGRKMPGRREAIP